MIIVMNALLYSNNIYSSGSQYLRNFTPENLSRPTWFIYKISSKNKMWLLLLLLN